MTLICKSCGKEKEIYAKELCKLCYDRNWLKNNPEAYRKQKERIQEWRIRNPEKVKRMKKRWRDAHPEQAKEVQRNSTKRYLETHPEAKIKALKSLTKLKESAVCNILKKHSEDLKNDTERLSTEFLQSMLGVKCKNKTDKKKC